MLRYGFRTTSGRIGGVRVEALARAAAAAWPNRLKRMVEKYREKCGSLVRRQKEAMEQAKPRECPRGRAEGRPTKPVSDEPASQQKGARRRGAGQKHAFSQEAECGDQRKMTEAIQDGKQEDRQKRMGGESSEQVSVAVSSPAKEKCIWRGPLNRSRVQAEAVVTSAVLACALLCCTRTEAQEAVHRRWQQERLAGRAGGPTPYDV